MGKSQIVEAIICAYILAYYDIDNHNINLIEFEVSVKEKKPILIFDLERTPADISKSLRRIVKRLNNIVSTEQIKAVIHYDQVMASELEDKAINGNESEYFKYLESVCDQYGCVIIEGVIELGGLDMNSAEKNGSNIKKIRQISGKNNVPIITTAHLNKGKAGEKTNIQGHTGSFLLKWSRAVIRTYCKPGFSKVQSLAADKLSHDDKNKIDVFHYYDESVGLRISTEDAEPTNPKDLSFFKNLPDQWQKYSIIRKSFEVQTGYHSKKVWQDYLTLAIDKNIIEKRGSTNSSEIRRKAD
jgi:RecA-family ATPase